MTAPTTVVIETTEVLDEAKMMASLAREPDLMMFTDGTTLPSLLSPEDAKAMEAGLAARGITLTSVLKMKPWMLSALLALPACEMARKAAGAPVLDVKLALDAKAAGKKLQGLETIADQLHAMASLPMEFHIKGLIETLKLGDRMDDVVETMIDLYVKGDTGTFLPLFRAVLPDEEGDEVELRRLRAGDDRRAQQDDDQERRADHRCRKRLHRGRRAAPAGPGGTDRASQESRPHGQRGRLTATAKCVSSSRKA